MKSKLVVASKASLLFVVLGFFLPIFSIPIVGKINGVQLANMLSEVGQSSYSFLIWLIPIFAIVSIILSGYFTYSKIETEKPLFFIIDFCLLMLILLCGLIALDIAQNVTGDLSADLPLTSIASEILGTGAYLVFIGWVVSFLLLIAGNFMNSVLRRFLGFALFLGFCVYADLFYIGGTRNLNIAGTLVLIGIILALLVNVILPKVIFNTKQ